MGNEMKSEFERFLSSLQYFCNTVLYSARSAGDWSSASIKQGIGWALYCEKAIEEPSISFAAASYLRSKPFREDYTVEDIKCLRKLFISNLFINQTLSEAVFASLIEISLMELGRDETVQLMDASVQKVNNYQMLIKTIRTQPYENTCKTFKVLLLVEAISMGSAPLSSLNTVLRSEDGFLLLLKLSESLSLHEQDSFLLCLGQWIKSELEVEKLNYKLFYQIASLSTDKITFLCQRYPGLHSQLLLLISFIGNKVCSNFVELKNDPNYKYLVSLCSTFLNSMDLAGDTKTLFNSLTMSQKYHFWHGLFIEARNSELKLAQT